jgi:DNA-binding LytR/AlgR family response regulator
MKELSVIIVDDNQTAIEQLKGMLQMIPDVVVNAEFTHALPAIEYLKNNESDVVFLDIEMPDLSGIQLVQEMRSHLPQIVFYTSNGEYALECYDYNVTDFLKKPVKLPRLMKCVERVKENKDSFNTAIKSEASSESKALFIKADSKYVKLDFEDILYIEASGDYVIFKTADRSYIVHSTMKNISMNMPTESFVKVHRSYIVNKNKIVDIEDMSLIIGKKVIPISRSQRDTLMGSLNLLK